MTKALFFTVFFLVGFTSVVEAAGAGANPVRKVITLLQNLRAKVEAEGEKETELFDAFKCYCKTGVGTLKDSIASAETNIPELEASLKESTGQKAQLEGDLTAHKADRDAAKQAMAEATALRDKEAGASAKNSNDATTNIAALGKAIGALSSGMGSFVQTGVADVIRQIAVDKVTMPDISRTQLFSFLSGSDEYAPASGQIVGILKQMRDTMEKDLAESEAAEAASMANFGELMAAKKKEVAALTKQIETKSVRVGELSVGMANGAHDLEDAKESLEDDKKFLADLAANCGTKDEEYKANMKLRSEELVALSDTIKIVSDDDALELFKKTLPSPASFLQVSASAGSARAQALQLISSAHRSPRLDLIALALHGKQAGFEKVSAMIDEMISVMKTEQVDDDEKKEYCAAEFDSSDDKKKGLDQAISDTEAAMAEAKGTVAKFEKQTQGLEVSIKALDESVAEATAQRKAENAAYTELLAQDSAAKDLLALAKNRLLAFYNPKLATTTLVPEEETASLVEIAQHSQGQVAPSAAPETAGAYSKKSEESTGVIAMIDLLVKDLDKEMTTAGVDEKNAQVEYEKMMSDSATKRAEDAKTVAHKKASISDVKEKLEEMHETKASTTQELMSTLGYIKTLHADCDWLVSNHGARKEARAAEIESLSNAKAVLNGANYS